MNVACRREMFGRHSANLDALRERWEQACLALNVHKQAVADFWDQIIRKYSEKHRFYHTMSHIAAMFDLFDDVRDKLSRPELVAVAIFFHDVVYEPKEKDNEERSAEMFLNFSAQFEEFKDEDAHMVHEWILATKKHETEVHRTPGIFGSADVHYFLDIDMSILGVSTKEYEEYAENIRKEYSHFEEIVFCQRRAKALRMFLTVPNIYATEIFRGRFEVKARENIQKEIKGLESRLHD